MASNEKAAIPDQSNFLNTKPTQESKISIEAKDFVCCNKNFETKSLYTRHKIKVLQRTSKVNQMLNFNEMFKNDY